MANAILIGVTASAAPGEWTFKVKAGPAYSTGGDVHQGPSFDGSVLLGLPAGSLPVDVTAKSFDDVYGDFLDLNLEFSYQSSDTLSYYFGISQLQSDEGVLRVGTVDGALALNGRFSDYDDLGVYGGVSYHFATQNKWKPRVAAQIGLKNVDAINATFSVPGVTFVDPFQDALTELPFYDDSDVWTGGLVFGLDYQASKSATIGLETGYYFQSSLDDNDSVLDVLGLGALNDEGDMQFMPIKLTVGFRF